MISIPLWYCPLFEEWGDTVLQIIIGCMVFGNYGVYFFFVLRVQILIILVLTYSYSITKVYVEQIYIWNCTAFCGQY